MQRFLLFLFIWLISFNEVASQDTTNLFTQKKAVSDVLKELETKFNVKFSYQDKITKKTKISLRLKDKNLTQILLIISKKTELQFQKIDERYYIVTKKSIQLNKVQILPNILITNYLTSGITKNKNNEFIIKPKRLGILAGLTEADAFESLHQLPMVTNPNETATQILVRGGNSDQNNVLFDGIPIYHKGHFYGMISPINPSIINKITFYNKGTTAKYNDRISSVIAIKTDSKIKDKPFLNVGLNGINLDINTIIPIVKNKLQIQTSLRRSFTELLETPTFKQYENKIFQTTKVNEAKEKEFNFIDYSFKISYLPNKKNQFFLSSIYVNNFLDFLVNETNNNSFNDNLKIRNYGVSFNWKRKWNANLTQNTLISFSDYHLNYAHKIYNNTILSNTFKKGNQIYDTQFLTEYNYKDNLNFGYRLNHKNASYAFTQKESRNTFILDTDNSTIVTQQIFANYNFNYKNYEIQLGTALNYYDKLTAFKIAPRIQVNKILSKQFKLTLTGEFKNQIISEIDETVLSDLTLDNKVWRLANGDKFPIIQGKHFSFGGMYSKNKLTIDLDFYYKNTNGITALSLGFLNPNNPNFNTGTQKNYGLEFYAKKEWNSLNFWLSYGLSNIQNKFENINQNNYFKASNEIKYNGTVSFSYNNNGFATALAWFVHSGKPYTKATTDANNNIVFDELINTEQLPVYHRLDASATYKFLLNKKKNVNGKIGFSIRNLYNQRNFISKEYIGNNSLNQPIKEHNLYGIGLTPNLLFRVWF